MADAIQRIDEARMIGRGISFPFRLGPDARVAMSSGSDNVREAIRTILLTEVGERIMLPNFGARLQSSLFEPNSAATRRLLEKEISEALERWEPRLQLQAVRVEGDAADGAAVVVTIEYKLRTTQAPEKISLSVSLAV